MYFIHSVAWICITPSLHYSRTSDFRCFFHHCLRKTLSGTIRRFTYLYYFFFFFNELNTTAEPWRTRGVRNWEYDGYEVSGKLFLLVGVGTLDIILANNTCDESQGSICSSYMHIGKLKRINVSNFLILNWKWDIFFANRIVRQIAFFTAFFFWKWLLFSVFFKNAQSYCFSILFGLSFDLEQFHLI